MSAADVKDALAKVFSECDTDKSGQIDSKEVEAALRKCMNCPGCKDKWDEAKIKQETTTFLAQADKNKDGKVSKQEFIDYYTPRLTK